MAQVRGSGRPDTERDERSGRVHRAVLLGGLIGGLPKGASSRRAQRRENCGRTQTCASLQTDTFRDKFRGPDKERDEDNAKR
jgi:hypothetical protein